MQWYIEFLSKYATFSGRARRKEYWMATLVSCVVALVLGVAGALMKFPILGALYNLAILIPSIAISARRAHDCGRSGWAMLIPFYNLYLLVAPGEPGANKYGPNPKNPTGSNQSTFVSAA